MKLVLDIKNTSKAIAPSKDNIILYDGKNWYITTKQEIFEEYEKTIDKKINELSNLIETLRNDNTTFKQNVSKQIISMSDIVEGVYKNNKE